MTCAYLSSRREQLLDIIGESDACNDDECDCHKAAWDAREELEELDALAAAGIVPGTPPDTRAADALAILSESLL